MVKIPALEALAGKSLMILVLALPFNMYNVFKAESSIALSFNASSPLVTDALLKLSIKTKVGIQVLKGLPVLGFKNGDSTI